MIKKLNNTIKIISNTLLAVIVLLIILLYGLKVIGLTPYTVLSGSMESVYPTGSVIYVKKVDTNTLKNGDVITFYSNGNVVATHRIVELISDDKNSNKILYRTKGDENKIADGTLIAPEKVIGSPLFCIPKLGYVAAYISTPEGKIVAALICAFTLFVEIIISLLNYKLQTKNEKN